ncbi:uroporphyrinogen-III C-methyltransferase [Spizellomyces punctatus DAOM BR117]|uniref:precorrin-2 dehydrogenase n=1 Tax=Spizellomyces punctatus (strain DAOM BR117) TaxID=645134 RepID=A0A0L0HS25_SPIPD|nr:uroporphyrinogen-III C-methyltransferase [Spizellomyces punctatus DAOM BR117]KND03654.1 uroporphyrinogen-III C-methyltransferase [Spizellomyces punctatus DAOM BR117]|eukprot:XP_016611693.1 uroporphyrinogen-III C-methyltransferase [Spizellomyces punctatus DAOM BR117]
MPEPRKVTGGASFIVGYRLGGKHVLVVGGGKEASGRVFFALDADARVTVVCPASGLNKDVETRVHNGEIVHIDRNFVDSDLDHADMVLSCIDEHDESRRIATLCRKRRIPVNCADIPELCDFYFMAQHRNGSLQIGVSTNGCGPRLGARLRDHVVLSLPPRTAEAVDKIGSVRKKIREADPDPESSGRRMRWLSRLCDIWSFEEIAALEEDGVLELLDAYERGDKEPPPPPGRRGENANGKNGVGDGHEDRSAAGLTLIQYAHSVPLVGATVDTVASATGSAWNLTTSAVSGSIETASAIGGHALDITSTYARALKETGSAYIQYAVTCTEDIVENGLRLLPEAVSRVARGTLCLLPLPIHVSPRPEGGITLVGAGPGDPGLLTLRALDAIRTADLVVSDQLISDQILALVPRKRLHLVQKKAAGKSDASQNDANETCLAALSRGLNVVRLKGGDPFLFGRGGEEVAFFREKGYEPKIVPGISSCIAAPESAFIPVTHRGVADQLLVLSGRGEGGAFPEVPPHYEKRTTVVLMAVGRLQELVDRMIEKGYPNDCPAAVVEKGCWRDGSERVVDGTLQTIVGRVKDAAVGAPALLVVGDAVSVLRSAPVEEPQGFITDGTISHSSGEINGAMVEHN